MMDAYEAKQQIERLLNLKPRVTGEDLDKRGRHFVGGGFDDLTSCSHGDTGNYGNYPDGEAIAILWNLWRSGRLTGHIDTLEDRKARAAAQQHQDDARLELVVSMVTSAAALLSDCTVTSGICHCGAAMTDHYGQDACGHLPEDEGAHKARRWVNAYESLMADIRLAQQTAAHEPKP